MALSPNPAASTARQQVVLIDHDVEPLKALVAPLRGEFEFHATVSASEALALLDHKPIAAIVTGQKLFSTSGLELLTEARRRSPRTTRVLLADAQERKAVDQSGLDKTGIEILARPCTAQQLKDVLQVAAWSSSVATDETGEVEHVVMETSRDQPTIAESTGAPVTVLTTDANLYDAIRTAVQGRHETFLATRLQDAAELAAAGRCPVLVTDMALAQPALERIARQLSAHEPALVTIVVGNREQGNALMGLLGSGVIHRFLLKPVTSGLARLAIDSAARHHQGLLSAPRTAPVVKPKPVLKPFTRPAPRAEPLKPEPPQVDTLHQDALRNEPPLPRAATPKPPQPHKVSAPPGVPPPVARAAPPSVPAVTPRYAPSPVLAAQREREVVNEDATFELTAPLAVEVAAEPPEEPPAATPVRRKRFGAMVGAGLALGLIVAAGVGWWWYQSSQPPPVDARVLAIQQQLAAAVAAFDAGRLVEPPGDNAAHYYAQVLKVDPSNASALDGLERIAERFIEQAENLMVEGKLDEAARALDAVRQVKPDHRRLRFLDTQLRKEQQDRLVLQAREAANAGDTRRAQELLAEAARIAPAKSGELDAAQESLAARERTQTLSRSLETARQRLAQGRLTQPANDSAKFHLRAAQRADPDSLAVQQGLRDLTERVLAAGFLAAEQRQYDAARTSLAEAEDLGAPEEQLRALRASIEGPRLVANAQAAIGQRQFDSATRLLNEARALGYQAPDLAAADSALRAARGTGTGAAAGVPAAAVAGSAVQPGGSAPPGGSASQSGASQAGTQSASGAQSNPQPAGTTQASGAGPSVTVPRRIRSAVPEYPRRALEQSQQGWVDVSFGITPEGNVSDARVEAASPRGVFDRSALAAVRQWRFEPRPPAEAYSQRIRTRVEFKLEE